MTHVTNLLSTDGEIKFRMCSKGCPAGALGDDVVVKYIMAITFLHNSFSWIENNTIKI